MVIKRASLRIGALYRGILCDLAEQTEYIDIHHALVPKKHPHQTRLQSEYEWWVRQYDIHREASMRDLKTLCLNVHTLQEWLRHLHDPEAIIKAVLAADTPPSSPSSPSSAGP
ncbi:hypothetical protein BGX28_002136, partial [Mortierella sp. GBA30]